MLTPADVEARKRRLKTLIVLGKERGFLTFAEINDHLPDDVLDAEQIEGVISMIGDMGIQVYDEAPDAETLLMSETAPAAPTDDVEEAAEAAVSTLDSEFGRTTDPVRMYMREMGSVELLTREGEIVIAKRIEEGLKHMIMAISACPMTVAQILLLADKIAKDEIKIDDLVDGLMDFNEQLTSIEETSDDSEEEEDEGDAGAIAAENLERLKVAALERFATIRKLFARMLVVLTKEGHKAPKYLELQKKISAELMQIRFSARQVERLCDTVRTEVDNIRQIERKIQDLVVHKGGMPRPDFIKKFPDNETSLRWIDPVDPDRAADRLSDRRLIAGDKGDLLDSGPSQALGQLGRVPAQPVGHQHHAPQSPVDPDHHPGPAGLEPVVDQRRDAVDPGVAAAAQPVAASDADPVSVHPSLDPLTRILDHVLGEDQLDLALLRAVDKRLGEDVGGELVDRCPQLQELLRRQLTGASDLLDLRAAAGQCPGLVEEDGARPAEALDRAASLDDHAQPGGSRDAGDQRHRRRQDQRAGGGDHEHRESAHRIAAQRPCRPGDDQCDRQQDRRVAVGHPHERRPLMLGLPDQADYARVGALRGRAGGAQVECLAGIHGAAGDRRSARPRCGQSLSGQGRLVDYGVLALHRPVDRHHLARPHQDPVADPHLLDRDLLEPALAPAVGNPRGALEQGGQLAAGAARGRRLERVPPAQHQRDHRASQVLAQGQRPGHRDQRDRVHPDVSAHQAARHRPAQRDQRQHGSRRPDQVPPAARDEQVEEPAEEQGEEDQPDQDPRLG